MDGAIAKKTQDTLGKIVKKPPLTEKLLSKPPFRFLHDIMTSVIKTTGFMKGLYAEADMNSENVKDKDAKIAFLQKSIDMVVAVTGKSVAAKPAKIVAGHEPERTNEFLQSLAAAINARVNNDEYVKKVLAGSSGGSKETKKDEKRDKKDDKERTHSASRKKDESRPKDKSQDREKDQEKRHKERDGDGGGGDEEKDKDRRTDRREKSRDREDRHKDRDKEKDRDRDRRSKKKETDEKENDAPEQNGEKESSQDTPSRLQRPTSAKGSRRRRQDEEFPERENNEPAIGENDLPPQIANARKLARPPSARPAPPRPKQDGVEAEPAMRLGTGAPANLIVDDGKQDDEEDENFLVEEAAPPPPPLEAAPAQGDDDAEHGALVKKMLESKKETEQQQQPTRKTEIERPSVSDAQRRKQRELIAKEIERLQTSIQSLTRSANPLGKIMDYVQEDMDSMQKELDRWRSENKEHALALRRERNVTDRAIEPLKAQLADLDRGISDQLDLIAASKSSILRNDARIQKLLQSIARS